MGKLFSFCLFVVLPCLISAQGQILTCTSQGQSYLEVSNSDQFKSLQSQILSNLNEYRLEQRTELRIPVVFHVVWNLEEENISDEQILSQLDALNVSFNGRNLDIQAVPEVFRNSVGIPGIEFCLAQIDPAGNKTSGINRMETTFETIGDLQTLEGLPRIKYSELGGTDAWDPDHYINIWVGNKELGIAEASFPGETIDEEQGVIIDPDFVGSLGTALVNEDFNKGRVLVHELGHFFNLKHLFGDDESCDLDDGIQDTPNQSTRYSGCPDYPQSSCNSGDMFMNYMALTNDQCVRFFTKGQVDMMMTTINVARSGLINQNCPETGQALGLNDLIEVKVFSGRDEIMLEFKALTNEKIDLRIFDISGKLIYSKTIWSQFFHHIDISFLPSGIFLLEINRGDDYEVIKFIKI